MKSFIKRLKEFKTSNKMSAKQLASFFNLSGSSISFYLNGKGYPKKSNKERMISLMENHNVLRWCNVVGKPISFSLEEKNDVIEEKPVIKTVREVEVGDIVVGEYSGDKRMVLERLQNTVILSYADDFKIAGNISTFDELEKQYTLKAEPVVDDKTAEAMKLLKEAGYKISKE